MIISGEYRITPDSITDKMKNDDPSKTEMPISIPFVSPFEAAEIEAKTSGAPAPKASKVTPASDSDSLNVFDIYCSDEQRYSSAVKLSM